MKRKKRKKISFWGLLASCLILAIVLSGVFMYAYYREKYRGGAQAYSRSLIRELEPGSMEYRIASLFYTQEEIDGIRRNQAPSNEASDEAQEEEPAKDIEIIPIYGTTYEGYMMLIHNPQDLSVAVNPNLGSGGDAPDLDTYVERYHAAGGTNAGGFADAGGTGNGSIPQGIVIHNGQLVYGNAGEYLDIVGITADNRLICTKTTAQEALSWGVQEAVTFGPTLINDYQNVFKEGTDNLGMLNPRTAIAQRGDGTFMLLVVDGRGPTSFGARYQDIIRIFQEHDAAMAANLDGGNSTAMIWKGNYVNTPVSLFGSRNLPTVFLVKGDD